MADPVKKAGRPAKLSVDQIVDAAIALIDEHGADRLSLRNVAQRLGVTPMALYKHVKNWEELELLIAMRISAEHRTAWEADDAADWRSTLMRSARCYEEIYREHPELAKLRSLADQANWNSIGVERLLSRLGAEGLDEEKAIRVAYIAHLIYRGAIATQFRSMDVAARTPGGSVPDASAYPAFAHAAATARHMDLSLSSSIEFLADLVDLLVQRNKS